MPSPNIPDLTKSRQDLPLPDRRIGALKPSLYGTIIHAALTLLAYLIRKKKFYKYIYIYNNKSKKIMLNNSNHEIIIID